MICVRFSFRYWLRNRFISYEFWFWAILNIMYRIIFRQLSTNNKIKIMILIPILLVRALLPLGSTILELTQCFFLFQYPRKSVYNTMRENTITIVITSSHYRFGLFLVVRYNCREFLYLLMILYFSIIKTIFLCLFSQVE